MRSVRHAELGRPASIDREALTAFVDACQVLVGRLDVNPDESTAVLRELLTRVMRRASDGLPAPVNFRVARLLSYLEDVYADHRIRLPSAARHVAVTPSRLDRLLMRRLLLKSGPVPGIRSMRDTGSSFRPPETTSRASAKPFGNWCPSLKPLQ